MTKMKLEANKGISNVSTEFHPLHDPNSAARGNASVWDRVTKEERTKAGCDGAGDKAWFKQSSQLSQTLSGLDHARRGRSATLLVVDVEAVIEGRFYGAWRTWRTSAGVELVSDVEVDYPILRPNRLIFLPDA